MGGIVIYILILIILTTSLFISIKIKRLNKFLYLINIIILTLMLCFRYGQGSDYFGYNYIFNASSSVQDVVQNNGGVHGEIGFRILCTLFNGNYELFIISISLFQMFMLHKCIKRYDFNPSLSLLIFFPTFYLTYFFSGIRQGLILSMFLGYGIEKIKNKEWMKWILFCLLSMSIHTSSIILLIIPFFNKHYDLEKRYKILLLCSFIGIILSSSVVVNILGSIPIIGKYFIIYSGGGINVFALFERIITLVLILTLEKYNNIKIDKFMSNLINVYYIGICIYVLLSNFSIISSRVIVYFKILEIIIIPYLLSIKSRYRKIINVIIICMCIMMTLKNIDSYIKQGDYFNNVNIINYPYISIFDKDNIWQYRQYPKYWNLIE